jgi:hypothetical protein
MLLDTIRLPERVTRCSVSQTYFKVQLTFDNYSELGFPGTFFGKHRLIFLMHRLDLAMALFMRSRKDVRDACNPSK